MYSISKKRFVYLDFIKALSIYLVCFYHYNNFNTDFLSNPSVSTYLSYFIKGIASTGVPLFLMVNGALMLNKSYNLKKHVKKTINIILLTIVWAVITLFVLSFVKGTHYTLSGFIKALWTWELGSINHLWFLHALVSIYILFPLIKMAYDAKDRRVLNYFLVILFIFTFGNTLLNMVVNVFEFILGINSIKGNEFNFFNNFNLFRNFCAYTFVYFIIGGLLLKRLKSNVRIDIEQIVLFFVIGICTLFLYGVMMSVSNKEVYATVWCGYDTIMTLLMSVSIFVLSYVLENKLDKFSGIIQLIGKNTLGIYFVHKIVGSILKPLYVKLFFSTSIIANLVFGVIVMMFSLMIVLFLKKVPFVNSLFKM